MELYLTNIQEWDVSLSGRLIDLLDEADKERLKRITHPKRQRELLVGRALVKHVLADLLGKSVQDIRLILKKDRIPVLEDNAVCFSLSHSGSFVVMAVDTDPIGVDIEQLRAYDLNRMEKVLTPDQQQIMRLMSDPEEKNMFFCRSWTMKEAAYKLGHLSVLFDKKVCQYPHFLSARFQNYFVSLACEKPIQHVSTCFVDSDGSKTDISDLTDVVVS